MTAVAETAALRMLAAAPCHGFGLGDFLLLRREARAFVRPVAKRLRLRLTARAPEINAGFNFLDVGEFLCNDGFTHAPFVTRPAADANKILGAINLFR